MTTPALTYRACRYLSTSLLIGQLLTACGGGNSGNVSSDTAAAASASQNPVAAAPAPALAAAVTVTGMLAQTGGVAAPWNQETSLSVIMKDAEGAIIKDAQCKSADTAKAEVSADCTNFKAKRLGGLDIVVTGGGASATLTLQGVPQRSWNGQRGVDGDDSFIVSADGNVLAWGSNIRAVLGQNAENDALPNLAFPRRVLAQNGADFLRGIVQVSAGYQSVLALSDDGKIWGWGQDNKHQLAQSDYTGGPKFLPGRVRNELDNGDLDHIVQTEIGDGNQVALRDDGVVLSWGNWHGQGDDAPKNLPGFVKTPDGSATLTNIVAVGAGNAFSTALSRDGRVYAWALT